MNMIKNKIKAILLSLKIKTNNKIRQIETKTGYKWENVVDSIFVGGLILVTGKLIYRISVGINPFWYINIGLFLLGSVLQLKYDILRHIREDFVNLWKPLLGWHYYAEWDYKNPPPLNKSLKFEARTENFSNPHDDTPKIEDGTLYNHFWQYVYIKLVQLRLWIMAHPYLYIMMNCLTTYWLITNNHLITASLISIMLLMSRMAIHASDYTISDLKYIINVIEKMEEDETIAPTYLNAEIMTIVATRSLDDRKHYEYVLKNFQIAKNDPQKPYGYLSMELTLTARVYYKYKELYPNYLEMNDDMTYEYRKSSYAIANNKQYRDRLDPKGEFWLIQAWEKNTNKRYKKVLEKNKKFLSYFLFSSGPLVVYKTLENNSSVGKSIIKESSKMKIVQNTKNNINPAFKKVPDIKNDNEKAKGHPVTYYFDKEKQTLGKTNASTIRQYPYKPAIHKIGTNPETGFGEVVTGKQRKLTDQETRIIEKEYEEELKKGEIKEKHFPMDYVPIFQSENLPDTPFVKDYAAFCMLESNIIQPECLLIRGAFLNLSSTKPQALMAATENLKYYESVLHACNSFTDEQQRIRKACLKEIQMSKQVIYEIQTNPMYVFATTPDPLVQSHLDTLIKINQNLTNNKSIPVIVNVKHTLGEVFDMDPSKAGTRHISNLHLIKKHDGGEIDTQSKKAIERLAINDIADTS